MWSRDWPKSFALVKKLESEWRALCGVPRPVEMQWPKNVVESEEPHCAAERNSIRSFRPFARSNANRMFLRKTKKKVHNLQGVPCTYLPCLTQATSSSSMHNMGTNRCDRARISPCDPTPVRRWPSGSPTKTLQKRTLGAQVTATRRRGNEMLTRL